MTKQIDRALLISGKASEIEAMMKSLILQHGDIEVELLIKNSGKEALIFP